MHTLTYVLFESPIALGIVAFVVAAACLLIRPRLEGAPRRWILPGAALLFIALFTLQSAVTTERERIWSALDRFIAAVESGRPDACAPFIADAYDSEGMSRDDIVDYIRQSLEQINIYDTRVTRRDVTRDGRTAEMTLSATATVSIRGNVGDLHRARWRITWQKTGPDWQITAIRPEVIDAIPIDSLKYLRVY